MAVPAHASNGAAVEGVSRERGAAGGSDARVAPRYVGGIGASAGRVEGVAVSGGGEGMQWGSAVGGRVTVMAGGGCGSRLTKAAAVGRRKLGQQSLVRQIRETLCLSGLDTRISQLGGGCLPLKGDQRIVHMREGLHSPQRRGRPATSSRTTREPRPGQSTSASRWERCLEASPPRPRPSINTSRRRDAPSSHAALYSPGP